MITIKEMTQQKELYQLKEAYFNDASAPLDGMWHFGFVPMSTHFGFYHYNELVGFCCINDDGYLLQFHMNKELLAHAEHLFLAIIQSQTSIGLIKGAFASTAEPHYFALCFDNLPDCKTNSLMYQHVKFLNGSDIDDIDLNLADQGELESLVTYAINAIGAPKEWLTMYYANLIERKELWCFTKNDQIIATGECRFFDQFQSNYAELGVIVAAKHRGQGIATRVLDKLARHASSQGLHPICSTEKINIAAQKAIENAGFYAPHRIVKFDSAATRVC